ncbi:MAG: (2Fe-2S)-binding protein [Solirubrobacterales bacterium]|nr:(2Fe-2S)-binding protein [Solirubrobacterales bacterium]MBV9367936.1 (2Fe-2S)-binding protein [Solirubrobacterales bacterium]
MQLNVNGVSRAVSSPPLTSLLEVLREELAVLSPKHGCEQGGCGACTVLVDGEPRRSCLLPLAAVGDARITTVEGLGAPGDLAPVQSAFHDRYAAQCGYCTSGMLLAAHALIERKGGPVDRDEVLDALSGHVCRCTGYVKIVEAVMAASRGQVGAEPIEQPLAPEPSQPEIEIAGSPA